MKVIFVIKTLSHVKGGAERVLTIVANGLACKPNYDVQILTFDRAGATPTYPISERVKLRGLEVGDVRNRSGWREVLCRIALLRATLKRESPDVVIPFMSSSFVPVSLALALTGIPVVASEHGVFSGIKSPSVLFSVMGASFFVKKITCLSEAVKMTYPWIIRRKMVSLPNPVPQGNFARVEKKYVERRMFLSVGRLEGPKDFATLVAAFELVASELPEWDLYIYGEGGHREMLEGLIARLNLESRVFLPGVIDRIEDVYQKADIFVSSSRYESFGLAAAEAMTFEVPCIGFQDCSGINEIVVHKENGLLADGVGCPEKLAMSMKALAKNESQRVSLGKQARILMQKFDVPVVIEKWESLIGGISPCQRSVESDIL